MLKSIEKLRSIRASTRTKASTPGARILSSMLPARGIGWPGGWGADRLEQVMHFRNWNYVSIHTICSKIGMLTPNIAYLHHARIPGKTTKYAETIRDFGGTNFASVNGIVTPTTGFMYRKSLGVVKPHEDLEPVEFDHPLRRLIENPNKMDTSYDLFYELQLFMELCGVSYLWMVPNGFGVPCELWVIPAHWVRPRTNGGGYWNPGGSSNLIDYHEVRPWGGTGSAGMLKFPAREVLMFSMKSPLNKLDGWSPQTAGAMWIDTEESIVKSRWAQMCNQARADVHIEIPGDISDPDDERITRIEAKFMAKYQGELNYGKPIFTPAGTRVTPLSFSPQEMAYFQCFDEKTECLTAEGWKKYNELTPATRVACYDPDTGKLVYRIPTAIHVKPYKGKMYRWDGQRVDAMMTPNHRVYVNRPTTRSVGGKLTTKRTQYRDSSRLSKVRVGGKIVNEKVWGIKRVEELAPKTSYGILAAAPAACDTPTAIMLEKFEGWRQREEKDTYGIDPEIWLTFLGHYLSEGWASCREVGNGTNGWEIGVCQKKYVERFRESLAATPFSWRESTREDGVVYWSTSDKGLYNHLVANCGKGALNKRIPDYVKAWPAEYLQILLDALLEGDGTPKSQHTKGRGGRTYGKERSPRKDKKSWHAQYYTSSRQLADDVMEIAVKCGLFAALTVKEDPREEYLGRERFTINIASRTEIEVCAHNRSEVEYEGNIWCVTVPTGLFVVRRNGKAHITGNSEEQSRDMVLALRQFPKTAAGISNDMTFGAVLATAASLCSNSINPRLMPLGLRLTKDLALRFTDESNPIRVWWDDTSPADPQQVNADISQDLAANAITPNEVRALRGRPAYKNGGNDPMISGPGGMVPLPLNTGEDLTEIGELVPAYPKDDVGDEGGGVGGDDYPEGDDGGGDYGGMGETPKPKLSAPRIQIPNNGGSLSVSNLSKGYKMTHDEWIENSGVTYEKVQKSREFSSTQLDLGGFPKIVKILQGMQSRIDPEDLVGDGLETDFHVTVKYGLKTDNIEEVKDLIRGTGPLTISLGKVSLFPAKEPMAARGGGEHDVVKVEVTGEDLHRLNALLSQLPHKDTYPVYSPHVTLAYVAPGIGERYVSPPGKGDGTWGKVTVRALTFSDKDGFKTRIPLGEWIEKTPNGFVTKSARQLVESLPDSVFEGESPANIPLSYITLDSGAVSRTRRDIKEGRVNTSGRPVNLQWNRRTGLLTVEDGMHRIVAAMDSGKSTIQAYIEDVTPAKAIKSWDSMEDGGVTKPEEPQPGDVIDKDEEKGIGDTVQSAGRWLASKWESLEARYGRKAALAMAIAGIATFPIPGNIGAIVGIAEGIRGVHGYFQREFPEGVEKAETEEKCGGEGGTPGPCPATPAVAPSKKPPARKGPHVDAAKEAMVQMGSGTATLNDLDEYTATLRELSPTKLRAVAETVGLDPSKIDPGDLRSQIGEKLNDIRGAAKRKPSPETAPVSPDSVPNTETEAKPPSPEKTRENAATAVSVFDKLDSGRNYVKITDLRREMANLSKPEFDAAINHLRRNGFTGGALEGREGLTQEELDTAIRDPRGDGQTDTLIGYLSRRNPKKAAKSKLPRKRVK